MSQFQKKEIIQAVLIADDNELFRPISDEISTALIPLVNVPIIDYALESLNRCGIEEVFIISNSFVNEVRKHIKQRIESGCCSWSIDMKVHVIGAEGSRCLGDSIRDLDTKGLIRDYFILMNASTMTNANLLNILEKHKKTAKFDKGATLTICLKEMSLNSGIDDQLILAIDGETQRLHYHHRIKSDKLKIFKKQQKYIQIPLEIFLNNSNITVYNNLLDPNISICSQQFLSLFSDNFDFENLDDFIRGLLINEEILNSRIYVHFLLNGEYGKCIKNWLQYQLCSNDVLNRWLYPLIPDMGIYCMKQNYIFLRNNIYKSSKTQISKIKMFNNIIINDFTKIDNDTILKNTVIIGKYCIIGKNCQLMNVYLFDNVHIGDNCILENCIISNNVKINENCKILNGTIIGSNIIVMKNSILSGKFIQKNSSDFGKNENQSLKMVDKNQKQQKSISESDDDNDDDKQQEEILIPKLNHQISFNYEDSDYNSSSDEEDGDGTRSGSPILDDTNIFLSEVIDSLNRGFNDKSNPNYLILEINSSRYAYNMSLNEVNFYVIKAIFTILNEYNNEHKNDTLLNNLKEVVKYFTPIILNYIKTNESMLDCLRAIEECLNQYEKLKGKSVQIVHYFYDKEFCNEDSILKWYENLSDESHWLKNGLKKLIEWLTTASSSSSDEEDESE